MTDTEKDLPVKKVTKKEIRKQVYEKLQEANNVIDEASKRSRVIERKLKSVQELTPEHTLLLLGEDPEEGDPEDEP